VDRIGTRCLRSSDDRIAAQVRLGCGLAAECHCDVNTVDVQRVGVRLGVHPNSSNTEPVRGTRYPDGDLTAVGDK
jgi:hypothetical protein